MKVNPNLSSLPSTGAAASSGGAAGVQGTSRTSGSSAGVAEAGSVFSSDDVHLSELVRSLQALAVDSPQQQARIEYIARSAANGSYRVDAPATASKIVDDALQRA